ncbi:MAG: hypothetical protein EA406_12870 [Rhodospirillales bacterium]|nr:MAG: hypothetical protein EA406_12870 [Rhodospirillales bacterium]
MSDKSRVQAELDLLSALERGEVVTQMALSKRLSVSVGLVNALLRRVVQKGLVKAKAAPYKRWAYYLTPHGFTEKSRLVAEYLEVSLDFFRKAREEYAALLGRARACGITRVVLVGGGELAEIALLSARDAEVEIIGILERVSNADRLYGLPVLRTLDGVEPAAALVMTASRHPQEAFDAVRAVSGERQVLVPALLRISERRPEPAAATQRVETVT